MQVVSSASFSSTSSSAVGGPKGRLSTGCRRTIPIKMVNLWLQCFLLAAILEPSEVLAGGGEVWSSLSYPKDELGPDNWRYYRAELPPVFSLLTISLTRDWAHDGDGSSTVPTGPLVCFGFHGPPLPAVARSSLLEAAIRAGASHNASATGECGWFNETIVVNVTNLEVRSGLLHVGIFSESRSTRTQSKMIARGKRYRFTMGIQVFWCGTEALGGPDCNLRIASLPHVFLKSLFSMKPPLHDDGCVLSSRSSVNHVDQELSAPSYGKQNGALLKSSEGPGLALQSEGYTDDYLDGVGNRMQDDIGIKAIKSDWSDWIYSSQKCIGLDENQFYRLEIVDFFQELEIKYDCLSNLSYGISKCEEFESMVKESRIPLIHFRYSALPGRDTSDFLGEPTTASLIVPEPRRGLWFLAMFNPLVTSKQEGKGPLSEGDDRCLQLKWRARACRPNLSGDNCQWPVLPLERILSEVFESPFDSYYFPGTKSEVLDRENEWFSLGSLSNDSTSNTSLEQWRFGILTVPNGAAGGFLSVDMKTSLGVDAELYARYEGCPSIRNWDIKASKDHSVRVSELGDESLGREQDVNGSHLLMASKYRILSLFAVYPVEGYWCIGMRYFPHETSLHATEWNNFPHPHRQGLGRSALDWIHRWKLSFRNCIENWFILAKPISSKGRGTNSGSSPVVGSARSQKNISSGVGKELELRLTLHGCPNKCSGHGHCQTAYEADRLHLVSFCRCDVRHGGFDCSESLLGPWNVYSERFLLIFSNAAAILPSAWALRHKAYSEWITFTLSGISSAIYHSCDAGGWCAMSYSTLQFLDFWLSFMAIIMTCLIIAGFHGPTKAMLHIVCSVLTAAVAKEDATSGWSVVVVVLISSTALLLGWGLETQKVSFLGLGLSASATRTRSPWLQVGSRVVLSFLRQLRDRFRWPYLFVGLSFLSSALISNLMESPETYWIFHSWWHTAIYSSAFILLHSIRNVHALLSGRVDDVEGYEHISTAQNQNEDAITDSHDALASELESFPNSRID